MPWRVESYDLHDGYSHGEPPTSDEHGPISIAQMASGPHAMVLARALFLNGYRQLFTTPEEEYDLDAPRAQDGRTWLDMPQATLRGTRITLADGAPRRDGKSWPARAERIEAHVSWTLNGATTRKTLTTDLRSDART